MRFGILGAVEVWDDDGKTIAVGGPRVRALLAFLLLSPGKVVPAEYLIDGLYGEDPPAGAANALQSQVSRLRRGLKGLADVELLPAGYRLAVHPDEVDAHRFLRLVRESPGAEPQARSAVLGEALALWRGAALADVPAAQPQAVRFEELRITATEDRAEADLSLGRHRELISELQGLVEAYPLRERPRGLLMRALYGAGRQAEALEAYERARQMLAEELGTDPSAELSAVHLAILRAEPEPTAPAAPEPVKPRLPAQLTSYVSRDDELERLAAATDRLITLLGPGGAGKTRLSIEAGARLGAEVAFADLATVASGAGQTPLAQSVMTALGLREAGVLPGGQALDPIERLTTALADRELVLIFDNCEHVIADAASLARTLLAACPGLRIIATSREALGITGERLWPVKQLAVPSEHASLSAAAAAPAVRLFADRAAAVRPGFTVTAENLDQIIRICSALDGQPLAIELAAARLRSLTVAEVAERLGDRFRLLSRGDRTKDPRHQTLRSVVEWSWGLLTPEEQTLARRLTVFTGGRSVEAVAAVCDLDVMDAEDLLADLADKSLLQRSESGRYWMLDTISAYCSEKLGESGEEERLRRAHASYFLELARSADAHSRSAAQVEWLARLTDDYGNLNTALRWALDADLDVALDFMLVLTSYWWLRGMRSEAAAPALALINKLGSTPTPGREEEFVLCVAHAAVGGAHVPDLPGLVARGNDILDALGRPLHQPFLSAIWALAGGPPAESSAAVEDVLASREAQFTGPWPKALVQLGRGYMYVFSGQPDAAVPALDAALVGFRALGERWGMTQTLDALAGLAHEAGDVDRALILLDEALEEVAELDSQADLVELLARRADFLLHAGRIDEAVGSYDKAGPLASRAGVPAVQADILRGRGEIARRRGDLPEAETLFNRALSACPPRWFSAEVRARAFLGLARIALDRADPATARTHATSALTEAQQYGMNYRLVTAAETLLSDLD